MLFYFIFNIFCELMASTAMDFWNDNVFQQSTSGSELMDALQPFYKSASNESSNYQNALPYSASSTSYSCPFSSFPIPPSTSYISTTHSQPGFYPDYQIQNQFEYNQPGLPGPSIGSNQPTESQFYPIQLQPTQYSWLTSTSLSYKINPKLILNYKTHLLL